jgi:hypothetical protein
VLLEIAAKHQVILTTHNPLFVARNNISSNIIVSQNRAAPAKTMHDIRQSLGVRPTDNLQHAELVLLVEGEDDRIGLTALLPEIHSQLASELAAQTLVIEPLMGASKLAFRLQQLQLSLCPWHCLLDNDKAGRDATQDATSRRLLKPVEFHLVICNGMRDSELEHVYRPKVYAADIRSEFGVDIETSSFKGKAKWSDRMSAVFRSQGKPWDDATKAHAKLLVASAVAAKPASALIPQKSNAIKHLADALVDKLTQLRRRV